MIGKTIGHYRVVATLGRGGMGVVYKAEDLRLDRHVALKFLPAHLASDAEALTRFEREARAVSSLAHPNICSLHDLDEYEGHPFMILECMEGSSLRKTMEAGRLPVQMLIDVGIQVARGLEAAHGKGIVHRDIKPENVFVRHDGLIKILDFGIARPVGSADSGGGQAATKLTGVGGLVGTFSYMSPEQIEGKPLDGRSDLFSLGILLFEAATGKHPFNRGSWMDTARAITSHPPPSFEELAPDVPLPIRDTIGNLLEKTPDDRYQTATELIADLKKAATSLDPATSEAKGPSRKRVVALLCVLLGLAVVLIASLPWLLQENRPTVAFMHLRYEGPAATQRVAFLIPSALHANLSSSGLRAVPLDSSGTFEATEDPRQVGQQLHVQWVVGGNVKVAADRYQASLWLTPADRQEDKWNRKIEGTVEHLLGDVSRLVPELCKAVGFSPQVQAGQLKRGFEDYIEGKRYLEGWDVPENYQKAEEAFRRSLQKGSSAEAHAGLALALWQRFTDSREPKVAQEAKSEAEIATTTGFDLPESHLASGVVSLGMGRSAEAAASFQRAMTLSPADDAVCRMIAKAYAALDRRGDADRMFSRALELRPQYWENYAERAKFYLSLGKLDEAKADYRRVIDLRPKLNIGYTNLAAAHMYAGEFREAKPLLEAALGLQPTYHVHNNLGIVYYSLGSYRESAKEFLAATRESADFRPWLNLGEAYRHLPDPASARKAYEKAAELSRDNLTINPDDSVTRSALALALAGCGQCEQALTEAEKAAAKPADDPQLHYLSAIAFVVCKDEERAISKIEQLLKAGVLSDVRTNPDLSPLLSHPQVRALLPNK